MVDVAPLDIILICHSAKEWVCRVQHAWFTIRSLHNSNKWGVLLTSENACVCFTIGCPVTWLSSPLVRVCRDMNVNAKAVRHAIIHG